MGKYLIGAVLLIGILAIAFGGRSAAPFPSPTPEINETDQKDASQSSKVEENQMTDSKQYSKYPDMIIDQSKSYTAILETNKGTIRINLFAKETPKTVNNFVFLTREGFYNGVSFHRIIKGFMIQGGDPQGNGTGGPGYKFEDEKVTKDYKRGIIAMANAGPNTNGSQFFIMHQDYDLPKNYTIFGEVIEGIEVVDKIAEAPTSLGADGTMSKPTEEIKIIKAEIVEK